MKRAYKTLSVLMALLIAVAFVPWGGMRVKAAGPYYINCTQFGYLESENHPTSSGIGTTSNHSSGITIILDSDASLNDPTSSKVVDLYYGLCFSRDPENPDDPEGFYWDDISSIEITTANVSQYPRDDVAPDILGNDVIDVSIDEANGVIHFIPTNYGTYSCNIILKSEDVKIYGTGVDDPHYGDPYYATIPVVFNVKKVIKSVDLTRWFMPVNADGEASLKGGTTNFENPLVRTEGLRETGGSASDPDTTFRLINWKLSSNDGIVTLSESTSQRVKLHSIAPGLAKLHGVPEYNNDGTLTPSTALTSGNSGQCDIVVAKVKPEDKIIYVGQSDTLTEDAYNTFPDAAERSANSLSGITTDFSLANSTGTTGTKIDLSDDKKSAIGKAVGYEPIKAVMTANDTYYKPAVSTVEGTGTVCVIDPEFLIPPRVVNCDETGEQMHPLYETGVADEDVKFLKPSDLPAGKPEGFSKTKDNIPEIPPDLKGVKHTATTGSHTSIATDSTPGSVTGTSTGVDTITAQYAPKINGTVTPRADKTDSAKAAVVHNLELSLEDAAGGDLGPKNADLSDNHTIKYVLKNSSDSTYITLTEDGHVTPRAVTDHRIPVDVTITRTVGDTVLKDTTVCYVTVKDTPLLNIDGLTVRYTGLEVQNSLPISKNIFKYTKKDGTAASGIDIGETLAAADWTPTKGISTFSKPNLKPKSGYDAVGNELLTAPASVDSYIVKDNKANLKVDIYGYEFLDNDSYKRHYDYTKGSKKDLKYKIDLKAPSSNDSTKSMVKTGEAIYNDELEKITISDKNGTVLTKNGAKKGTDYDLKAGSVEIILHPAYLDTLDPGTYTLTGYFTPSAEQGKDVDTLNRATFTIKPPSGGVKTEDVTRVGGVTVLFGTSLAILLWLRKKRRDQASAESAEGADNYGDIEFSDYRGTEDIYDADDTADFNITAPGTDSGSEIKDHGSEDADPNTGTAESHGRFRKYDPFDSDVRDSSQENAGQRTDGAGNGAMRGQVKHLPPKRVALDEDAREYDRRARYYSPDQRERMMEEERRRYYERRYDDRVDYRYGERDARYRDEMDGYYPRRHGNEPPRGNGRRGGRRPY